MWPITYSLVALCASLFVIFYRKRKRQLSLFKEMGIPGPEPHWLYGNLQQLKDPAIHIVLQKWTKQYKKIYGYYEGCRPILVTTDLDIIQEVFVKKYSSFHGRKELYFSAPEESDFNHMFSAKGARWKRLRTIINPTFSALKLKQMLPLIEEKVNTLVDKLTEAAKEDKPINIVKLYQGLTMDVIADVAFGVKIDSLNHPDEPFLVNCRKMFEFLDPSKLILVFRLGEILPELDRFMWHLFQVFMLVIATPQAEILKKLGSVIETRQKEKARRPDLLQLMLDAKADNVSAVDDVLTMRPDDDNKQNTSLDKSSKNDSTSKPIPTPVTNKKKLTVQEIKSQSFLFLTAGYETTSTVLSYCTYLLAKYPDVQQKLLKEIDEYLPQETKATYDILRHMSYLHMVLCETLRLYPLASNVVNRKCVEACNIGGMDIPEGVTVQADVWSVHYDPDVWGDDPEHFIPERFSKEAMNSRHPMAWMPFGIGPRNCIGLRFALLEAKLALAEILRRYSFEKCSETEDTLQLQDMTVIVPKNGVKVKLVPRQQM